MYMGVTLDPEFENAGPERIVPSVFAYRCNASERPSVYVFACSDSVRRGRVICVGSVNHN